MFEKGTATSFYVWRNNEWFAFSHNQPRSGQCVIYSTRYQAATVMSRAHCHVLLLTMTNIPECGSGKLKHEALFLLWVIFITLCCQP